ncbi:MAG: hypothetical protein AVDCRST_MAG49-2753, partial [uncultured Thermomicrobiales bacterium]
ELDHRDPDPGPACCRRSLAVLAQSPRAPRPGERPLHDPAFRQRREGRGVLRFFDRLDHPATNDQRPDQQRAAVDALGHLLAVRVT